MESFCIHLEDRPDRKEWVENQFAKVGILSNNFYSSNRTTPGWIGCRDAHLDLLWMTDDYDQTIIFEDDVEFVHDKDIFRRHLNRMLAQLPDNWDALYLGASPQSVQERFSDNLFRAKDCLTTHAILWNCRPGGAVDYINNYDDKIEKIDVFFKDVIQAKFNCFLAYPMLCIQHEGLGTDTCKRSDVSTIVKNYKKYCNG